MKSTFYKYAQPLWNQYDEDRQHQLDENDFYMVATDILGEITNT